MEYFVASASPLEATTGVDSKGLEPQKAEWFHFANHVEKVSDVASMLQSMIDSNLNQMKRIQNRVLSELLEKTTKK